MSIETNGQQAAGPRKGEPLRAGIPTVAEVRKLVASPLYRDLECANEAFLRKHRGVLWRYGVRWSPNPMRVWSRRWEYAFVADRLEALAAERGSTNLEILDAGSGVTFLPYHLCRRLPGSRVTCCDINGLYAKAFARIGRAESGSRVRFARALLQRLPVEADGADAVYCVSVLEHTGGYGGILDEFRRVLRPGGRLVLTFDISLDGKTSISRDGAARLLEAIAERFDPEPAVDLKREMRRLDQIDEILTTDHIRRTAPQLLPWKQPLLKSVYDLLRGKGWTGGFYSLTCFCLSARARP